MKLSVFHSNGQLFEKPLEAIESIELVADHGLERLAKEVHAANKAIRAAFKATPAPSAPAAPEPEAPGA